MTFASLFSALIDPGGYCRSGKGALRSGDWEASEQALRKAVSARPFLAAPWDNLGRALLPQGKYAEALKAFNAARRGVGARRSKLQRWCGIAALGLGDRELALTHFRGALRGASVSSQGLIELASLPLSGAAARADAGAVLDALESEGLRVGFAGLALRLRIALEDGDLPGQTRIRSRLRDLAGELLGKTRVSSKEPVKGSLVYVASNSVPSISANSVHVVKMSHAFRRAGMTEVLLIAPQAPNARLYALEDLVTRYDVAPDFGFRPVPTASRDEWLALARAADAEGAEFVYGRHLPALALLAAAGRPVCAEVHLPPSPESWNSLALTVLSAFENTRLITSISRALEQELKRTHPWFGGRWCVAHDGADAVLEPTAAAGRFEVGYVGHLYDGKGAELILPLAGLCPWANFKLVGGTAADVARWKLKAQELPNVEFCGHLAHAEAVSVMRGFTAVLAPYQAVVRVSGANQRTNAAQWMSPLKIFEYMAAGRAILCSDLPVLREVLTDGQTALLCNPEQVETWAAALERLRDDPQLGVQLGERARHCFLEKYTWEQRARQLRESITAGATGF